VLSGLEHITPLESIGCLKPLDRQIMEFNSLLISLSQELLLCLSKAMSHGELVHAFYCLAY